MTTQLVDQANDGEDLFDCYNALENYFGQLAAIQAQGLDLMIEALHQTQNPLSNGPLTTFMGDASDYYTKFTSQMDTEVEMFLFCVDRLVMSQVDVRSEIAQKFAYISPETAAIYSRADFVATKLSTKHPAGLIIRLIGDPTYISDWVTNNKVQVPGLTPVVVNVNGNATNQYAPVLPVATPAGVTDYLEWTASGTAYTFNKQTQVSIVKLCYATTTAGSFTVTVPDATQNQTLSVALLNDAFQPATSTDTDVVAYGSGVFYSRVLPTWQTGAATKTQDTSGQYSATWTPDPQDAKMSLLLDREQPMWWLACPASYSGQLMSTICNGTQANMTVALNWNGTRNLSATWKAGGSKPGFSGSQSLTCQTTQTNPNSNTAMTFNVTLAPNTNTGISYNVSESINNSSIFDNGIIGGDSLTTNAWLNSLELVPQQ